MGEVLSRGRVSSFLGIQKHYHKAHGLHVLGAVLAAALIQGLLSFFRPSVRPSCSPDVLLADEHTGVVDGLGQALLEHQRLQPALQHIVGNQGQGIIQLVLGLVQQAVLVQPAHEGLPLENALGVLLVMLQQGAGCVPDL